MFTSFTDIRLWIVSKYRIALAMGWGAWWCPLLPKKVKLTSCVGRPIPVTQIDDPTPKQVDELQEEYIRGLKEVFDLNKKQLGYGDQELILL